MLILMEKSGKLVVKARAGRMPGLTRKFVLILNYYY